jgi:hypothetical protein
MNIRHPAEACLWVEQRYGSPDRVTLYVPTEVLEEWVENHGVSRNALEDYPSGMEIDFEAGLLDDYSLFSHPQIPRELPKYAAQICRLLSMMRQFRDGRIPLRAAHYAFENPAVLMVRSDRVVPHSTPNELRALDWTEGLTAAEVIQSLPGLGQRQHG